MWEKNIGEYTIIYDEKLKEYPYLDDLRRNYLFFKFRDENTIEIFDISNGENLKYDLSTKLTEREKMLECKLSDSKSYVCNTNRIKDKIHNFLKEKNDEKTLEYFVKVDTLLENLSSELLSNTHYTHFNFFFKNIAFKIKKNEKDMFLELYKNNSKNHNIIIKDFFSAILLGKKIKERRLILSEVPRIVNFVKNTIKNHSKKYSIFDFHYNVCINYSYESYIYKINFILKEIKNLTNELILFTFYLGVILEIYLKSFEKKEDFIHCLAIYTNILKLDKDMDCYDIAKILIDLN